MLIKVFRNRPEELHLGARARRVCVCFVLDINPVSLMLLSPYQLRLATDFPCRSSQQCCNDRSFSRFSFPVARIDVRLTAELAARYKDEGMLAYVNLIQRKEKEIGCDVLTHQKWYVGVCHF